MKRPITRPRARQMINQMEIIQKMALDLEIELPFQRDAGETRTITEDDLAIVKRCMEDIVGKSQDAVIAMTYYAQRK